MDWLLYPLQPPFILMLCYTVESNTLGNIIKIAHSLITESLNHQLRQAKQFHRIRRRTSHASHQHHPKARIRAQDMSMGVVGLSEGCGETTVLDDGMLCGMPQKVDWVETSVNSSPMILRRHCRLSSLSSGVSQIPIHARTSWTGVRPLLFRALVARRCKFTSLLRKRRRASTPSTRPLLHAMCSAVLPSRSRIIGYAPFMSKVSTILDNSAPL